MNRREIGRKAEKIAEEYLIKKRYKILFKNFRSKFGEIDLIAIDKNCIVFIEVKMRAGNKFGNILYSIDKRKKLKIIKTAKFFLTVYGNTYNNYDIRFDALMIEINKDSQIKIGLIKNAFTSDI